MDSELIKHKLLQSGWKQKANCLYHDFNSGDTLYYYPDWNELGIDWGNRNDIEKYCDGADVDEDILNEIINGYQIC